MMKKLMCLIITVTLLMTVPIMMMTFSVSADTIQTDYNELGESSEPEWVFYELTNGTLELRGYNDNSSDSIDLVIPSTYEGKAVTSIGKYAFQNNKKLISVTIPDGIVAINGGAFKNCTNLEKVTIPNTVKRIEGILENNTYNIRDNEISYGAFENCSNLSSIIIPDSVEYIGPSAFRGCSSLKMVSLSSNLKYVSTLSFEKCISLISIKIPKSVELINIRTFWNCPKLKDIYIFNPDCQIFRNYETVSGAATIHGYEGSTAEMYAANYNRTFELIEDKPIYLGDTDSDGYVTIIDVTLIQRRLIDLPVDPYNESAADADGDGLITIFDATLIQRYVVEIPCPEGIGKIIS